jgi:hypothetical protein
MRAGSPQGVILVYIYIKEKNNEKLSYGFEDVKGVTLILVGEIMELC